MNEPSKIISLVLGDWSDDGHGKTDIVNILSNLDKNALFKAYQDGTAKLGFNFIDDVCEEYEDSTIPKEKLDILINHGFSINDLHLTSPYDIKEAEEAFTEDSDGLSVYTEAFAHVFLFIVKLGDSNFQFKVLAGDLNPAINIGGYGLFN